MQQLVILLLINCSTCFGRLYAHAQEVRLRFHCIWLSVLLWLLWWRVGWQAVCTVWSTLLATYSTQCTHAVKTQSDLLRMGVKTPETCWGTID